MAYPLAGMIFDVFDGKVARWRNESSMLGQELDSLADSVRFYLLPWIGIDWWNRFHSELHLL